MYKAPRKLRSKTDYLICLFPSNQHLLLRNLMKTPARNTPNICAPSKNFATCCVMASWKIARWNSPQNKKLRPFRFSPIWVWGPAATTWTWICRECWTSSCRSKTRREDCLLSMREKFCWIRKLKICWIRTAFRKKPSPSPKKPAWCSSTKSTRCVPAAKVASRPMSVGREFSGTCYRLSKALRYKLATATFRQKKSCSLPQVHSTERVHRT